MLSKILWFNWKKLTQKFSPFCSCFLFRSLFKHYFFFCFNTRDTRKWTSATVDRKSSCYCVPFYQNLLLVFNIMLLFNEVSESLLQLGSVVFLLTDVLFIFQYFASRFGIDLNHPSMSFSCVTSTLFLNLFQFVFWLPL